MFFLLDCDIYIYIYLGKRENYDDTLYFKDFLTPFHIRNSVYDFEFI